MQLILTYHRLQLFDRCVPGKEVKPFGSSPYLQERGRHRGNRLVDLARTTAKQSR